MWHIDVKYHVQFVEPLVYASAKSIAMSLICLQL